VAADEPAWCRRTAAGWTLDVHVRPGARRSGIAGLHGSRLKIRVAAPALDGRANAALAAFIAGELGLAKSQVAVVKGERSRDKVLAVTGDCDPLRLLG
jgi:hypothetical protein